MSGFRWVRFLLRGHFTSLSNTIPYSYAGDDAIALRNSQSFNFCSLIAIRYEGELHNLSLTEDPLNHTNRRSCNFVDRFFKFN
jgi:hypothetical protein